MVRLGPVTLGGPQLVLGALATATLIGLLVAASTSSAAFGAYNAGWDGGSALGAESRAAGASLEIGRDPSAYDRFPADGTVALVLSPDRAYPPADRDRLRRFVIGGGTLVVAEDVGPHSNGLLRAVGADARIDGRPLRDEREHFRSPALPVATNVTAHPLTAGVESLTLNHGTAVAPNGATVLVGSSPYAYLDVDRDGRLDDAEAVGSVPVVTVESVGDGTVVVIGDPSLFINTMLERRDNRAFVRNLFVGHERGLLDLSHRPPVPPVAAALLVLRESPLLGAVVGLAGVLGLLAWERRPGLPRSLWRRIRPSRAAAERGDGPEGAVPGADVVVRSTLARRPDWDPDRARRIAQSILKRNDRKGDDG